MNPYRSYMTKAAKERTAGDRAEEFALGTAATAVGAKTLQSNMHNLHGRETFMHGTSRQGAEAIKREGIKAKYTGGPGSVTDVLKVEPGGVGVLGQRSNDVYEKSLGKTYLTQSHDLSGSIAMQHRYAERNPSFKRSAPGANVQALNAYMSEKGNGMKFLGNMLLNRTPKNLQPYMVHASIPTWKPEYKNRMVINPEFEYAINHNNPMLALQPKAKKDKIIAQLSKGTFEGDIGPEVIKGSEKYQKLTAKEIGQFIRHNPARFAKGVGIAALGTAGAAWGAHKMVGAFKKDQPHA